MPTLIGSIPTTQADDLELAKRILNGQENLSSSISVLQKSLEGIFKSKEMYLFNRGREALYFALKTLGINPNDEVIIQAMTCVAVITPILWLNARPVYVDINENDFNIDVTDLEKKITSKTRAIVVQHTFGNISNMKKISEIARKHNIYIIEDCAHLFYTDYSKTDINKYSDISFFSFAQDKGISAVQGGLVVVNNPQFKKIAMDLYLNIEDQNPKQALYNAKYIQLWSMIKKYYFTPILPFQKRITLGKALVMIFRKLGMIKQQATSSVEETPIMNRISDVQSALLLNQLKKCDYINNRREELVNIYNEKLSLEIANKTNTKHLLRYPILLQNPILVMKALQNRQYICGRWYNTMVFPMHENLDKVGYVSGSCPKAEVLVKSILNLPTNIDLEDDEAIEIAKIVNENGKSFKFSN
ncbi:aminotransferase class I/II-fold pyridoxal phosphate-dependent enzyme [Patescibacteria group bacterium]|nr:aminotransferase class I/II-fold pyridoxal phosphate-dependent enzyme [Patescibacteria group bacterium]